jgi:hypothetical protein
MKKMLQIQSFQTPEPKVSSANMRKRKLNTIQIGTKKKKNAQRKDMRSRRRGR